MQESLDTVYDVFSKQIATCVISDIPPPPLVNVGSSLLDGGMVTQPPGHYTDDWKPANHDPHRIFVSPSIKYCSFHDVYTKKHRYTNLKHISDYYLSKH